MFQFRIGICHLIMLMINLIFFLKITGCVDRHAPIKELTPKEIKLKSKPWITPNINMLIRNKNKLFIRKRQPNNAKIKVLYNQKRN